MVNKFSDLLTYCVLAVLCFVFAKEGASYVAYDMVGVTMPVMKPVNVSAISSGQQLKIVTYNILVSPVGLDRRAAPLFKLLKESDADVIALQEVGTLQGWFMLQLDKEDWAKNYFRVGREPDHCNGQLILSRIPVEEAMCHGLPGGQGRTVLIATLKTDAGPLKVATTHMESPLESINTRARQFEEIFRQLGPDADAIMLGDFNAGDGEASEKSIDAAYTDMWKVLKPGDPGYTWDIEKSEMANQGKFEGEPSRRLDRILVRSKNWKPQDIKIIGDEPTDPGKKDMFPSDHFGLWGVLSR